MKAISSHLGIELGASVMDWWDDGEGSPLKLALQGPAQEWQNIIKDPNASPEAKTQAAHAPRLSHARSLHLDRVAYRRRDHRDPCGHRRSQFP